MIKMSCTVITPSRPTKQPATTYIRQSFKRPQPAQAPCTIPLGKPSPSANSMTISRKGHPCPNDPPSKLPPRRSCGDGHRIRRRNRRRDRNRTGRSGADLVLVGRTTGPLEPPPAGRKSRPQSNHRNLRLTDRTELRRQIASLKRLDILVNNAVPAFRNDPGRCRCQPRCDVVSTSLRVRRLQAPSGKCLKP